jgi:hypothetical protein
MTIQRTKECPALQETVPRQDGEKKEKRASWAYRLLKEYYVLVHGGDQFLLVLHSSPPGAFL